MERLFKAKLKGFFNISKELLKVTKNCRRSESAPLSNVFVFPDPESPIINILHR